MVLGAQGSVHRGESDQGPARALRDHLAADDLPEVEHLRHILLEVAVPLLRGDLLRQAPCGLADDVDAHVDATESGHGLVEGALDLRAVGHVGYHGEGRATDRLDFRHDPLCPPLVDVDAGEGGARLDQLQRALASVAGALGNEARPGHEGPLSFEAESDHF